MNTYVFLRIYLPAGEIYVTFIYFKIVVVINVELLLKSPWSCLNRINQQLTNIFELWTHQTPSIKLRWSYGWVTMHLYKNNSFLRSAFVVYRDTYGLFINTFIWSTEMTKRKKKILKDERSTEQQSIYLLLFLHTIFLNWEVKNIFLNYLLTKFVILC